MAGNDPDMDAVAEATPSVAASSGPGDPDMDAVMETSPPVSFTDQIKRQALLAGRNVIQGVSALPVMAMDAGVGVRNLIEGKDDKGQYPYELPSSMFNRSLDQFLPHAQTGQEKFAGAVESGLAGSKLPVPGAADQAPAGFTSNGNLTPSQVAAMQQGKAIGMKTTPAQESGSKPFQQVEAALESQPWTSGPASAIKANNASTLNRSWANAIGEDTDTLDSTTLARANDRLGGVFNSVRDQTPRQIDPDSFLKKMTGIESDFEGMLPGDGITSHKLVQRLIGYAENGSATGEQLGGLTSKLGRAATREMTTPGGDRELGQALYQVKDYTDDLVSQGLSPEQGQAYSAARQQYRALMQLTSRVGNLNSTTGNVSGPNMANYLQKADKNGYLYGGNQSSAYAATRFAQAFKPIVGDSGTATRSSLNLGNLAAAPVGIPANLASRLYYSGAVKPKIPGSKSLSGLWTGAASQEEDDDR